MDAPAEAQDVPRFDVEKHCKQLAGLGGSYSATMDETCFDMEQKAYNAVKSQWLGIPKHTPKHCAQMAGLGGSGSYSMLQTCLDMETTAASNSKGRKFKY
jgi:hypothetical protein